MRATRGRATGTGQWLVASAAWSVWGLASGCTTVLGIDEDYVLQSNVGGRGGDAVGARAAVETGGDGGRGGTGGSAGADATGGTTPENEGGDSGGAGGCTTCEPTSCKPGLFAGSFEGTHALSLTVVGAPVNVLGTITFRLGGADTVLDIEGGRVDAQLSLATLGHGKFNADVVGTYDCTTQQLDATFRNGRLDVTPVVIDIEGTLTGNFDGTMLTGNWHEEEVPQPSPPSPAAQGSGSFSASWTPGDAGSD